MWGAPATRVARSTVESHVQSITAELASVERQLWVLVVLTAALDVSLTAQGLQAGLTEGNPVVAALVHGVGIGGLIALKLGAIGIAGLARWHRPDWGPWLSLGLALPWLLAVCVNAALLSTI